MKVNNPMDLCYIVDGIPAKRRKKVVGPPKTCLRSPSTVKGISGSTVVDLSDTKRPSSELRDAHHQLTGGQNADAKEQMISGSENEVYGSREPDPLPMSTQASSALRNGGSADLETPLASSSQQPPDDISNGKPRNYVSSGYMQPPVVTLPAPPFAMSMEQARSPTVAYQYHPHLHVLPQPRPFEAHPAYVATRVFVDPHQPMHPGTAVPGQRSFIFPPPIPIPTPPSYVNTQEVPRSLNTTENMALPLASAKRPSQAVGERVLVLEKKITPPDTVTTKTRQYGCEWCGRFFYRRSDLARHIQIHLGIKPNLCPHCGKAFIQRSALTVHLRVHTGEKPYSCKVCGRLFSDSSSLARHRRIHQRQQAEQDGSAVPRTFSRARAPSKNSKCLRLSPAATFEGGTSANSSPTSASTNEPLTPDTPELEATSDKLFK